ncbi:hypothetical protein EXIGLDRAFT_758368 [Exidia glandulosa HHB12029]|uniref:Uncharacterized protein n=1 Tax=Exidia glandulosa HHB12029 TaxID=1314781 RepID=A0A165QTZ8_EXIGL|nr:hypothetical protein EXIGLDRAFT_758368 [Exidia glandulosa HHB12029]
MSAPSPTRSPARKKLSGPFIDVPAQRAAVLRALRHPPPTEGDENGWAQDDAFQSLRDLLDGTITRGEGNTCMLLGPKGCGKTRIVDRALDVFPRRAIVVRLSGHAQLSDRHAIREMARQIGEQTGRVVDVEGLEEEEESDVDLMDDDDSPDKVDEKLLPPSSQILSLVARLPSLPRPVVVVIDALDLFTAHARQALLYCLFDTAQSIRIDSKAKGLAVIGVTSRVDTINLLEKRVKSRFSHRVIRLSSPQTLNSYIGVARALLSAHPLDESGTTEQQFHWDSSVEEFLADDTVHDTLSDVFGLSQDVGLLCRVLTACVLEMTSSPPYLSSAALQAAVTAQCGPSRFPFLSALPYPHIGLLIAANHCRSAGHDVFTFEMLHERFETQIRTSSSAPVQLGGVSIGMLKCPRSVMSASFEHLIQLKIFQSAAPTGPSVSKQFAKYRCVPDRHDVRLAVEETGQTNLRKWLLKDQT